MSEPQTVLLIAGGRNGSLLLQSLLDGHPDVAQFPGVWHLKDYLNSLGSSREAAACADTFIRLNPEFFDTRLNPLHGMNRLGEDRDQWVELSTEHFRQALACRLAQSPCPTVATLVRALHGAYAECSGDPRPDEKRVLLVHVHVVSQIGEWSGPPPSVLFMERDPLPSLQSEIDTFMRYYSRDLSALLYWSATARKILEPTRVVRLGWSAACLRLEDLHREPDRIFDALSRRFALRPHQSWTQSTFFGRLWWGDDRIKAPVNGLNPNFRNQFSPCKFFKWELSALEHWMGARLTAYGYGRRSLCPPRWPWLLMILPARYEWKCLRRILWNLVTLPLQGKVRAVAGLWHYRKVWPLKREMWRSRQQLSQLPPLMD